MLLHFRAFALLHCFNLEGKKGNLEGTWRVVVGHLEGKGKSPQTLDTSQLTGIFALTWRVFRKSIYKRVKSEELRVMSERIKKNKDLQKIITAMTRLSSLTAMPFICVQGI